MAPAERIAQLKAVVDQQREHIERLLSVNAAPQERMQELEARLAKDSGLPFGTGLWPSSLPTGARAHTDSFLR